MHPLDEYGAWEAKSKKEYDPGKNGECIRLAADIRHIKFGLTDWNNKDHALLWRKAWADISNAYLEHIGSGRVSSTTATPSAALTSCLPSR